MPRKNLPDQALARRSPRQERSQLKVELMLEAAMQLLDGGELAALTTNAVAAKAGVSIGTLYQYFGDKAALLDALVAREMEGMARKVMAAFKSEQAAAPGDRIRLVVRAVVGAYGGRGRVRRMLMQHALTQLPGSRLSPMYAGLMQMFTADGIEGNRLTPAQAFVITHAMAGVLRTLVASTERPPVKEVEDELVRLAVGYVGSVRKGR